MHRLFILATLIVFIGNPVARSGEVDIDVLDERVRILVEREDMFGLSTAVVERGETTFSKGYGITHEGGQPVTEDTVFRWSSLSKSAAATLAAMLEVDGDINLDDPLSTYTTSLRLPSPNDTQATMTHLLSQQLGIIRNAYDLDLEAGVDPRKIRAKTGDLDSLCVPGTCYAYQNIAFDTVAEIIEQRTAQSFSDVLMQRLFEPLEMTNTSMGHEGLIRSRSYARPHHKKRGEDTFNEIQSQSYYYRLPAAAGVNSSIKDLTQYMKAQMGLFPDVLSHRLLSRTQAPQIATPGQGRRVSSRAVRFSKAHYGLGWRMNDYTGHRVIRHTGTVNGYGAFMLFDPNRDTGLAVMWNSSSRKPFQLQLDVMDMVYGLITDE